MKDILVCAILFVTSCIPLVCTLKCEIINSSSDSDGPEMGIIFVPGAKIEGQAYKPLTTALQNAFPGKLWVGLTEDWSGDMPNPIQIGHAIDACFEDAEYVLQ